MRTVFLKSLPVCIGQQYRIQAVDGLFEEEEDNELIYFYAHE